eukprot:COSAG01_NODE_6601_length_3585_cov_61.162651_4_plen_69_part_00
MYEYGLSGPAGGSRPGRRAEYVRRPQQAPATHLRWMMEGAGGLLCRSSRLHYRLGLGQAAVFGSGSGG